MFTNLSRIARMVFRRNQAEHEMDAELRFHLEMETKKNMLRGMGEKEARQLALRSFGGVELTKEQCRDARGGRLIDTTLQDLRYGARVLRRNPGFTLVALLTLTLGIGANTAIFSVIYGVLMRPLPYAEGDRLVVLHQQAPLARVNDLNFSVKEITDYREQSQTLDQVVEHHSMSFILLGGEEAQRVQTAVVSANFFDMLGIKALHGRTFLPSDDEKGADAVLVLSYNYWKQQYKSDPNIVGRVFRMNDKPHTVIGVLPPIPQYPSESDVYMPTVACPMRSSDRFIANRTFRMMNVFGRLKPGVTVEQAQADLSAIANNLQRAYPDAYPENRGYAATLAPLQEELTRQAKPTFLILLGTAGLVLLIACANVANLTLARLMQREREMAIRAAMGAGRGRLIRQMLTESTMLALAGGALGLLVAAWGLHLLVTFAARFTPRAHEITIDGFVLLFTLLVSLGTGLAFGLMPVLGSDKNLSGALKENSRTTAGVARHRARNVLVVAQVALSFMLLMGAGLMMRSLLKLQSVNPGFNPESVLTLRISPNWSHHATNEQYRDFTLRLLDRVRSQPGVQLAALGSTYPLNANSIRFGPFSQTFEIEGRAQESGAPPLTADARTITPDYFETLKMPMVQGRAFAESDNDKAPLVALINQTAARHYWGDEDPLDRRITFDRGEHWLKIVGVVGDVKQYGLDRAATDELYTPHAQNPGANQLLVRTATAPMAMAQLMREVVRDVDPETAVDNVQTLERVRDESLASPRLTTVLLGLFAALAMVITAAGIAGVMALTVTQRTHEIGVRMALGASSTNVMTMVVRQGMTLVAVGLAVGAAGAFGLARMMSSLLFAVTPSDPLTFGAVAFALTAIAAMSCLVPARRVTRIDPMLALRAE
ncbi:MAG: ADOP family duplicated permease [Blastocatellia bacterium]